MRICIASVLILDLSIRLSDLEAFYTDTGAVPLNMVFTHTWNDYFISLHTISGRWEVQLALFIVALFCALMLFIGYRTKLFTVLSWFMLLSLHNRNELILQGGDDLLRMVLFWAMFIPWGAAYSYDSLRSQQQPAADMQIRTLATFAYLLQVCYVYTGSALLKGPEWHTHGTALYYVYSLDQIDYPITSVLYQYPDLLRILTYVAWYFELLVPLLFFVPLQHSIFRAVSVLLIFGFHLFNGMTIFIGLFFMIGIATSVGLLPTFVMDRFDRFTRNIRARVSDSFAGIAYAVQFIIPWKQPRYVYGQIREKANAFLLVFLIFYVLDWNLSHLNFVHYKLGDRGRALGYVLRIDQCWGMFAPGVFKDDGWYILEGVTQDGREIDLMQQGKEVSYEKPRHVVYMFKNDRWRKYSENLLLTYNEFSRGYFCNYYKRDWNERHPRWQIKTLRIVYMMEFTQADYQYSPPTREVLCECR